MFWDKVAKFYDLFEKVYNEDVNTALCMEVGSMIDKEDLVLECACGTGMISRYIAIRCKELIATDYSIGMLKEAKKKSRRYPNIKFRSCDINHIRCEDETFDKVVAGNVVHLLEEPELAMKELERVCKKGGQIIIPTYVNYENEGTPDIFVKIIAKLGANFKCQFDYDSYTKFFADMGYEDVSFTLVEGKMPCAIAVITKK